MTTPITKEEIAAVFPTVAETMADGFGDEAGRERRDDGRHREHRARPLAGLEVGDAVDERERREVIRHGLVRQVAAAGASRWAVMTSLQNVSGVNRRGMSLAFIGVLKRSAGISER